MEPVKVLYLEDNPLDVKVLQNRLNADDTEFFISYCSNEEQFKQMLGEDHYDIIISDYYLPPYDGFKALEFVQKEYPLTPFILISGVAGEELAVEAIKRGASDYILKENLFRLTAAIHKAIQTFKEKKLKYNAEDLRSKYDFIINTSRSFMSLIDRTYTYEAINNAFAAAHNLVKEEVIGKSLTEVWGENNFRKVIKPNLDKSFANNEVHYQAWFETPKHGKRFFEVTFYPFLDEEGDVTHTVVDTFDITERKITEEALRESEEKYRTLIENAQDGICIIKDEKIIFANPIVFKKSGYKEKELLGKSFWQFVDPVETEKVSRIYKDRMVGHEVEVKYDSVMVRKDGARLDVELNVAIIQYAGEKAELVILRDISDRKQAEEILKQNQQDVLAIIENSEDFFWSIDKRYQILIINDRFKNYFQLTFGLELQKGMNIVSTLPQDLKKLWKSRYDKALSGERFSFEDRFVITGNEFFFESSLNPIKDPENKIIGVSAFSRDITDRKIAEREIKQHALDISLINDLNDAVNRGENLEAILERLWTRMELIFDSIGAGIYLVSPNKKELVLQRNKHALKRIRQIEKLIGKKLKSIIIPFAENSKYWNTFISGDPYYTNDNQDIAKLINEHKLDSTYRNFVPQAIKVLKLSSMVNIPLFSGKEPLGILTIARKDQFNEHDITRLVSFSIQVSSIFERLHIEEKNKQHSEDQGLINDINQAVNEGKDFSFVLKLISDLTRRMFPGYGASVYLISDDQKYLLPTKSSLPEGIIAKIESMIGSKISSLKVNLKPGSKFLEDINSGKPKLYKTKQEINALIREFAQTPLQKKMVGPTSKLLNLKHLLNIPLVTENIPIGILNISKTEPFTFTDIQRLENISSQVTSIISRKRAEEDFFESEHKFKAIFETANDAIFLLDNNRFIDCNQRTLEMFRCSKSEILGKTPVNFSPEFQFDGRPSEESANEKINKASKGSSVRFEWVHKRPDNSEFLAEVSLNKLELKGKAYLQAIVRDISQRKKAEQELVEKEKGLREAQRIAAVGSWEWDMINNEVVWSDETYHILGLEKENITPNLNTFLQTVKVEDRERVQTELQTTINNNTSVDFFHDIEKPGGERRSVHSRAEIVLDTFDKPIKFIGTIHDITDLRRAEKAYLVSEEKFRAVFEKGQFAMVLANLDGNLVQTNKAAQDLFGYSAEELSGMPFVQLTHKEDLADSKTYFTKLIQDKIRFFVLEKRYVRKDGKIIYCHIGVSSIRNDRGEIINTVGMIIDVTEQKVAEQQIKHRTQELTVTNTMNTMINAGKSIDQVFKYFAESIKELYACHVTGFALIDENAKSLSVENISGSSRTIKLLEKIVNARVRKHYVKPPSNGLLMQCIIGKAPQLLETREEIHTFVSEFSTKPATQKIIPEIIKILNMNFVCNFPLYSGNEKLGMIITVAKEKYKDHEIERMSNFIGQLESVIIRKRVEEERIKLSTVVEQMAETVVITDTKGNLQYANPAFELISGYSREEAMNRNMNILKSNVQGEEFYKEMWDTISKGFVWNGKIVNKRKDGSLYEERAAISPLTNEEGRIVNYVAVKEDITRESQLEDQLMQSQKLETVGTLARGIAHDFNNILATILGYNEMAIEDSAPNEKVHKYLNRMKTASLRARDLVSQILTFSRDFKTEPKLVKIKDVIKDSLTLFHPNVADNIKTKTEIDKTTPPIFADPLQLQQVILNLLTNANQAMKDSGGTIIIGTDKISTDETILERNPDLVPGDYVRISVTDTGIGMDADTQQKIFEPFFSTKPVGVGTGLGLSVVHGIVKNHNGVISFESEEGKGTTFNVYLPV